MKYIFLTKQFYIDYANCPEIEYKTERPYIMLLVKIENNIFAVPLRSHIKHKFAYFTDKLNYCGADYSKAVIITNSSYIDTRTPRLRPNEYKALLGKSYIINKEFMQFLKQYKKAVKANAQRASFQYKYCTLQYFHKELGL